MYDKQRKIWVAECSEDDLKQIAADEEAASSLRYKFFLADKQVAGIGNGEDTAQAVAAMEEVEKEGYADAIYAMGQMYFYGWGVHEQREAALDRYRKAAEAGCKAAQEELEKFRKKRIINKGAIVAVVLAVIAIVAAVGFGVFGAGAAKRIIKVNEKTDLSEVTDISQFNEEIFGLIGEYDDEAVIEGRASTNRLILKFEGEKLDLQSFMADKVIVRENNVVIIQFSDEAEAKRCLEELKKNENVIFVKMDEYTVRSQAIDEEYCTLTPVPDTDYTDEYYSWGVKDMGLDVLSDYVNENFSDEEIVVAVIDSGALVHSENKDRYITPVNAITGGAAVPDLHGSHVTGTVLDGADCDNIKVWNIDVFNGTDGASFLGLYNALTMCVEADVDVINMSLGGPCQGTMEFMLQEVFDKDITVVVAAGNETADTASGISCPGDIEQCIVVGAYDYKHRICHFSNYGDTVDVCAPGEEIWSYSHEGDGMLAQIQGTSMASPHVAALVGLIKAIHPEATTQTIEKNIKDYCRTFRNPKAYATGRYGAGAPDATVFCEDYSK